MGVVVDRGSVEVEGGSELCRVELLMARVFTGTGSARALVELAVAELLGRLRSEPGFVAAVSAAWARCNGGGPDGLDGLGEGIPGGVVTPAGGVVTPAGQGSARPLSPHARAVACAWRARRAGLLPSCRRLAQLAEVSRGTAATALRQVRDS